MPSMLTFSLNDYLISATKLSNLEKVQHYELISKRKIDIYGACISYQFTAIQNVYQNFILFFDVCVFNAAQQCSIGTHEY